MLAAAFRPHRSSASHSERAPRPLLARYVGAQIVSLHGDEVQVRGIEGAPTPIQRTRLQYVSNQPFSAAELSGLEAKLRARTVKDMSVADAELAITELSRMRQGSATARC